MSGLRGLLSQAFQVGYVTADRAAAVACLSETLGLSGWIEFDAEMDVDTVGDDGERKSIVAVAFARWGRMVIEVVEPRDGDVEVFRRLVPDDATLRMHHVGIRVPDLAFARQTARSMGLACELSGRFEDQVQYAFIEATARLGHHLELVQFSPQGWELIAGILAGAPQEGHEHGGT